MRIAGPAVLLGAVAGTVLAGGAYAGIAGGSLAREAVVPTAPTPVVLPADAAATCGEGSQLRDGECVITVLHTMAPTSVTGEDRSGDDADGAVSDGAVSDGAVSDGASAQPGSGPTAQPCATEASPEYSEDGDDHHGRAADRAVSDGASAQPGSGPTAQPCATEPSDEHAEDGDHDEHAPHQDR